MKIRSLLALVGLAVCFTAPTLAQEQKTVDPEIRQQIEAVLTKYDDAFNKHDAAALADLYTQDAAEVWPWEEKGGAAFGQQAIVQRLAVEFASGSSTASKLVQLYSMGNDKCAITEYKCGIHKGYSARIYVRDADTWKIRLYYANTSPP